MKTIDTTVLIVGGGLAGLTLAGVLGEAGVDVVCIDRDPPVTQVKDSYDGRTTAVSFASHRVLQAAGAWKKMLPDCEPILDIRVADGASPSFLHFAAEETARGEAFGWIIENRLMRKALFENAQRLKKKIRHLAPAEAESFFSEPGCAGVVLKDGRRISAQLMIGADGRASGTRKWLGIGTKAWSYKQSAIVCNVAHAKDHENVAVEHFLPAGPFAVLPMTRGPKGEHRSSIVWTVEEGDIKSLLGLSAFDFDAHLQDLFGEHLGRVRHVSKPMAYPLTLLHADTYIGARTALMAEAAHVIHPIAGQGLNVSMRDIAVLAELIVDQLALGLDIGSATMLAKYESLRRVDTLLMAGFTDLLNRLFSNNLKSVAAIRDLGLGIVEGIPVLKAFFALQAMGLGGFQSRIIKNGHI